ncbi:hypothetical protein [uncultured Arcticibacterium sp.]|uniref:GH39 family glycosyl hydrolase n=1 Tax=uncultured Arcticibacterium sp. TaxID=2173042 RepID=UPI0030F8C1F8
MESNRRVFLKSLAVLPLPASLIGRGEEGVVTIFKNDKIELEKIGNVEIKKPKDIQSSPFGIGCETLDRKLWEPKEVYPWMDDLSVKWARLQTGWNRVEAVKNKYEWKWLDESVDGLIQRGFQPFFNVGYGNLHYTESERGSHPMLTQEAKDGWVRFVKALAKRYKGKVQYFEIWNEPNLKGFWRPGEVDASLYVDLVKLTGPIIRKNCPDARLIGGVTSRIPFTFIKAMFEAGLGNEIDIFSFHPYGTVPESYTDRIKALKTFITKYNPKLKLWQGENGFASDPNSTGFAGEGPYTENIQAKIMLRRLLTDCSLGIDMTLWFLIIDLHDYPKGSGKINYKGILRAKPTISPKVAFKALQYLGSLIHGDVNVHNSIIQVIDGKGVLGEKEYVAYGNGVGKTLQSVSSTTLNTTNGLVLAFWSTEKAADNYEDRKAHIILWDWEGSGFEDPVLIDPLKGEIFALKEHEKVYDNDKHRLSHEAQLLRNLPLRDYPLLIMEKKEVV